VTVAAKATVPGIPVQLTAATATSRGISLTWKVPASQGSSPITAYRVYRGNSAGTETPLTSVGNVLSYTDSSARSGARFYYTLVAVNASGQSAMSNEANARAH
jgi:fibronectin type 3 domain-containing protein